jgi:uracil-DNA glycosylase
MDVKINNSWKQFLASEFEQAYFEKLADFVRQQYLTKIIYPRPENLFRAFELCAFEQVKVVILGQDPYHGAGQAHGLCFSVPVGVPLPPSLKNISQELAQDLNIKLSGQGDLSAWAKQGVLLLNATLTVQAGQAGSHQRQGWEQFSDAVIKVLSEQKEHLVFILWGAYAQSKSSLIDGQKHLILQAPHPSPLSSYRGFFGSRPFSRANDYLRSTGQEPINWQF